MATWNLHLVGHELEDELEKVMAAFVTALEGVGHKLESAVLTTDEGTKTLATASVEDEQSDDVPVDTPPVLSPPETSTPST